MPTSPHEPRVPVRWPFVGRSAELDVVARALSDQSCEGVCVFGGAGVGKTRLAERLGVSRGSLREAVRALSQINVLDVRRGDATYVTSLAPSELLSGMVVAMELLQAKDVDEVVEVCQLLLPPAAALAAQRVTPDQLTQMRAVVDQLERATDADQIARLHDQFGWLLCDATGNQTLSSMLRTIQLRGENVRRAWLSADPMCRDIALAHLRMLLDALERGDSDMAKSICVVHLTGRARRPDSPQEPTTAEP